MNISKLLLSLSVSVSCLNPGFAGEIENFRSLGLALPPPADISAAPQPPMASAVNAPADPVQAMLAAPGWEQVFSGPSYEEQFQAGTQAKELLSDFHTRYLIKGTVSFDTNPPLLRSLDGKTFRMLKYPGLLREVSGTVCVEGYVRQRDNTADIKITKLLDPKALEGLMPSQAVLDMQRDPGLAETAGGFLVDNVSWSHLRGADGSLLKDSYGNLVTRWESGVKVNPELLETAYYATKNMLKPRFGDHGMLFFRFKPGGLTAADGSQALVLVVTLDAYFKNPSETVYSPIEALKGKYMVYYSVQTGLRYSEWKTGDGSRSVSLYPLKLSRLQGKALLRDSLRKAAADNKGEAYSLFYNSCANSALSLINGVLPEDKKIKGGWLPEIFYRIKTTIPDTIAAMLIKRGLASPRLPDITGQNYQSYGL